MHGIGKLTNHEGSSYSGKFKEGKKHGAGKIHHSDGRVEDVTFNRDKRI